MKCSVSIKMTCEWEQKFISGIDPTVAWQDIISTALRFGTSNSDSYGLSSKVEKKLTEWMAHPRQILKDIVQWIKESLGQVIEQMKKVFSTVTNAVKSTLSGDDAKKSAISANNSLLDNFKKKALDMLDKQIQKYRIEIEGIARALSGAPSTPWHITIGNPLRPVFCAGDMLAGDIALKLGPILAFNDLPSNIISEFTLTNARPWGMQEILAKFNAGSIRASVGVKDANSVNGSETVKDGKPSDSSKTPIVDNKVNASSSTISSTKIENNIVDKTNIPEVPVINTAPVSSPLVDGFKPTPRSIIPQIPTIIPAGISTSKESKPNSIINKDANSTLAVSGFKGGFGV